MTDYEHPAAPPPEGPLVPPPPPAWPPPVRRPFPGFLQGAMLCALFLLIQVAAMLPVSILHGVFFGAFGFSLPSWVMVASMGIANLLAFAAVAVLSRVVSGVPVAELAPFRPFSVALVLPMLVSLFGLHILVSELDNLLRYVVPAPDWLQELLGQFVENPWVALFPVVLVAPVTEEILFRGIILRGFLERYRVGAALVLSSILFMFLHVNIYQFAGAFIFGLVFAWWAWRTGSLAPCILGHLFVNGSSFLLAALPLPEIRGYNVLPASEGQWVAVFQPLWFDALGVALAAVGLLATKYFLRHRPTPGPALGDPAGGSGFSSGI